LILNWYFILFIVDFDCGFLLRGCHICFTSFIYLLLYMHLFKAILLLILFDTNLLLWFVGFLLFFIILIIAFIGYVLPCTMMSYWGLTVFSNILATIPYVGIYMCYWIWGCEFINDFTLCKLHSLHILMPFILLFLILAHFFCLHYFISSDGFCDRFVFYIERLLFCMWFYYRDFFLFLVLLLFFLFFMLCNWYLYFMKNLG